MEFEHRVGPPINLEELRFSDIDDKDLIEVAKRATAPGETIHNKSYKVTAEMVFNTMKLADDISRRIAEKVPRRRFRR